MFPLYLGGLVCILILCECLIFEKVSLHFHRVSLSNTEPTLQGFRGLKQHGDFRSFVLQFQVVRSEGHFRKRKIDSNLFFHRFHFFLSRQRSFVWCDCPSRNLYSVGEDLVLCRRCFLCEHFHSIQHAGWCCAWVSWDYITKVFVQYLCVGEFCCSRCCCCCCKWLRTVTYRFARRKISLFENRGWGGCVRWGGPCRRNELSEQKVLCNRILSQDFTSKHLKESFAQSFPSAACSTQFVSIWVLVFELSVC